MKKGFTLVELLIVIGILSLLTVTLMVSMGGGTESARSAKCLTNMSNLAKAVQSAGMVNGYYPLAGSVEHVKFDESRGVKNATRLYYEQPGWISWKSQNAYNAGTSGHASSSSWIPSAYMDPADTDTRTYCLTNGVLWKHISGNRELFVCPAHAIKMAAKKPLFTYVMNEYFGWDDSEGSKSKSENSRGRAYGALKRADRRLLFAEMQWHPTYGTEPRESSSGTDCDCTLQYSKNECIGFNHLSGRDKTAHVVFADGHTEKLIMPKNKLSDSDLQDLTTWLCEGKDVAFNGKKYEELQ